MLDHRKKRGTNGLGENNLGFRIKKMGKYSTEVRRMRCSESSVFPETERQTRLWLLEGREEGLHGK